MLPNVPQLTEGRFLLGAVSRNNLKNKYYAKNNTFKKRRFNLR